MTLPNNLLGRAVGNVDPSLNDTPSAFIPCPDAATRLGMQDSWDAYGFPLPGGLCVLQLDNNSFWSWNETTLSWVQFGTASGSLPYQIITTDGGTIVYGATNIAATSDTTQTISNVLDQGTIMKVFNSQPYNATVQCPTGWNFSDGDTQKILGQGSTLNLSYFYGQTLIIDSFQAGVTS